MQKNKITLFSCAALVAAGVGLNIQNAIADYGIGENSLSLIAVPSSGSGSNLVDSNASALASNTNGSDSSALPCYSSIVPHKASTVRECYSCNEVLGAAAANAQASTC